MNSRLAMVALTLGLTAAMALAQDDPVKGKGDKQGVKQLDKKDGEALPPEKEKEAREDPKKIMERIARNMVKVEGNLKKSDVSDATRKLQRDIVSDLDKLLEQEQNKNQSGGGGGEKQEPQNKDQKQQDQKQQQNQPQGGQSEPKQGQGQAQGQAKNEGQPQPPDNMGQQPQPGKVKPEGAKKDPGKGQPMETQAKAGADKKDGQQGKGQLGKAKPEKGENASDKLGDPKDEQLVKEPKTMKDVSFNPWGHLPERERPQMNIYAQDRFIPQFEDQLQRYYRALAAKNRQGKN